MGVFGGPTNLDIYSRVFGPSDSGQSTAPDIQLNRSPELEELAQKVMRNVEGAEGPFRAWEGPAKEDDAFYHGDQWDDVDRMRMEQLKRPALVFNEIKPVINGVSGLERLNRVDISFKTRAMDSPLQLDLAGDLATEAISASDDLCFIGDTLIRSGPAKRGFERTYKGTLIQIELSNGNKLTGTPNHPVLTDRGWKRLGVLQKGDDLIDGQVLLQKIPELKTYFEDVPTSIQEKVRAFGSVMPAAVPCGAKNFHADGIGSEVYIVRSNGLLLGKRKSSRSKQYIKRAFEFGKWPFVFGCKLFAALSVGYEPWLPFAFSPAQNIQPFVSANSRFQQTAGFRDWPQFHASTDQATSYSGRIEPYPIGYQARSHTVIEKTDDFVGRNGFRFGQCLRSGAAVSELISGAGKALVHSAWRDRQLFCDLQTAQILREIESGQFISRNCGGVTPTLRVTVTTVVNDAVCQVYNLDTECGFYIADGVVAHNCNAAEEDSDLAKECAIRGMAWAEIRCDYDTDINGRVVYEKIPSFEMRWDPNCHRPNLEGREWCARKRSISRKSFIKQYGENMLDRVDMGMPDMPYGQTEKYELVTPYYSLANERANPQVGGQTQLKKTVEVIQYQWKDMQPIYRFQDQDSQQITTLDEDKWHRLTKRMEMAGGSPPSAVKQQKPVYRNVVVSRGIVIEEPVDLPGSFSLICMTGEWHGQKKRFVGLVRDMLDPQKTKNKAISSALGFHITNAKGGVIFKTSAFSDPDNAKDQWSRFDAWIEANDEANIREDIVYREPAKVSPDLGMFYQEGTKGIYRASGLNEEAMGVAAGQTPSQTARGRQQGGLTVLGWFWDNLDRHRREKARCTFDFIREYWTQGQLLDVGGQELGQQIPLLKENLHESSWDYKLVLDESIRHNPNLKMSAWDSLLQSGLFQVMIKGGMIQLVMQLMKMLAPYPSQVINALMRTLAQHPPQPPQKGRGGGPGKPPENPMLTQAKVKHLDASTQKAIAQARMIDQQTKTDAPLKIAELTADATLRAHELAIKRRQQHEKTMMQALAKQTAFQNQLSGGVER